MTTHINSTSTGASTALPAAQPGPIPLYQLQNLLRLCAFAAEARRTLRDYADCEQYNVIPPEVQKRLKEWVPARCEWTMHDDCLGQVLSMAADQVQVHVENEDQQAMAQRQGGAA